LKNLRFPIGFNDKKQFRENIPSCVLILGVLAYIDPFCSIIQVNLESVLGAGNRGRRSWGVGRRLGGFGFEMEGWRRFW
jgi:hypothetical protein